LCWQTVEQQFNPALAIASALRAVNLKKIKAQNARKPYWLKKPPTSPMPLTNASGQSTAMLYKETQPSSHPDFKSILVIERSRDG